MPLLKLRNNHGLTLVETSIALGINVFIFGTLAFLIFMTGRNSYLVRDQSLSQSHAAAASERITNTLRNARSILPYGTDDMSTTLTRLKYEIPNGTTVKTGIVAYVPATNKNSSDGVIKIFEDATKYKPGSVATDKADYQFANIQDFNIRFHSESWVTIGVSYSYRGFSLDTSDTDNDGVFDTRLAGEFLTDAIAKNHHPGESAHYAETTSTLFQL